MDKTEFQALVEKYKKELMKIAGKKLSANADSKIISVNAAEPPASSGTVYPADLETTPTETYQQFIDRNQQNGYLKIQAFAAQQAIPVSDVKIKISKKFTDGEKVFFESVTDSSGIIENIKLPAPPEGLSETPSNSIPYSSYDVSASHPKYSLELPNNIQIFNNIKSILPIRLIPNNIE